MAVPPEAEPYLLPDSATHNRPFSLKHAQQQVWRLLKGGAARKGGGCPSLQQCPLPPHCLPPTPLQASIVGNMKQAGLLRGAEATTYIEYGAGKGYLW